VAVCVRGIREFVCAKRQTRFGGAWISLEFSLRVIYDTRAFLSAQALHAFTYIYNNCLVICHSGQRLFHSSPVCFATRSAVIVTTDWTENTNGGTSRTSYNRDCFSGDGIFTKLAKDIYIYLRNFSRKKINITRVCSEY